MNSTTPLFEVKDLSYKSILNVPQLTLEQNRIGCIIGASGSGKSTLLRMFNRMLSPDSGSIDYKGTAIDSIAPVKLRRRIVMPDQNPVMFDGSIRDNVLKGREFSESNLLDDSRVTELLQLVHLDKDLESGTGRLSGGERQRLAIARVLAMQPGVLLMDEPTSALDADTQDSVMDAVVRECCRCGTDLVIVTHAHAVAEQWGEHLIEMNAGRVTEIRAGKRDD